MIIRNVARLGIGLALAVALAAPAVAQQPPAPGASKAKTGSIGDNVGEISITYDYTQVQAAGVKTTYSAGWNFSAAKRVARGISLVASFGGLQGPNINSVDLRVAQAPAKFYDYAGGVRFSTKSNAMASGGRMVVKPFAEFLYGGSNDNATQMNHMSVMWFGGGIDLQMSKKASIRVGVDAPFWFFFGTVRKGVQGVVGLVIPFSK